MRNPIRPGPRRKICDIHQAARAAEEYLSWLEAEAQAMAGQVQQVYNRQEWEYLAGFCPRCLGRKRAVEFKMGDYFVVLPCRDYPKPAHGGPRPGDRRMQHPSLYCGCSLHRSSGREDSEIWLGLVGGDGAHALRRAAVLIDPEFKAFLNHWSPP